MWTKADVSGLTAADMRFLIKIEGKAKRDGLRNEKNRENLKINTLEGKITINSI
jgi:hypothetical protein